jgi:serine/threonine-protein kinase
MTLEVGALINPNVRLTRLLGQGGMGAVWLAEHLTLRTQVAVKFILASYTTDADALDRFTREATSAARIKSPNVVQVFDHGLFEGLPYIVMEYLEGEDLDARIARGPLALGELQPILQQIGKALTQAHGLGIIHRDIKPANVFLTHAGDELLVKLLDFGIAKNLSGVDEGSMRKTQTGHLVGTPCFLSPEQVFSRGAIDHRVDLWALAVLVYEALTGDLPFQGTTLGDMYISINNGTYTPPTRVDRAFPAELDAWFARAFAREIGSRFGSARELCDAFQAVARKAPEALRALPAGGLVTGSSARTVPLGTLGGTSSSGGPMRAKRSKVAMGLGVLAGGVAVGALAFALIGRPSTTASDKPSPAASVAQTAIAEPTVSASAAPAPTLAASAPAVAPAGESAPPMPASAAAPSAAKTALPMVRPAPKPTASAKSRDHGF